jgi:energy-coupling factor transport system ATP-binding protein
MEYLMKLSQLGTSIVAFEHRSEYFEDIPQIRKKLLNGHQRTTPIPHPNDRQLPVFSKSHNAEILQVKDLSVRLSGKTIVNRLNFELRGGTLTAIVGRNGSGKTTLLRALAGLQPHDGTVTIGSDRPNLGLVYQNADLQLFNPTVKEEILFRIPDPDMALYHSILEVLGLTIYQDTQPLLLSEGEKKRVALASVLMRQPEHGILLDEPSLGQDILHKEMLVQLSNALTRIGKIVVMTTHDLSLAAQADEIILLRESGIVAQGPTDQILKNDSSWDEVGLFVPEWVTNPQGWDHV